jgi:hypothetical protein
MYPFLLCAVVVVFWLQLWSSSHFRKEAGQHRLVEPHAACYFRLPVLLMDQV